MSEKENIVITGMARTLMGVFQGTLKDASCAELGGSFDPCSPGTKPCRSRRGE